MFRSYTSLFLASLAGFASIAFAASLTEVSSGWENPTNLQFFIYVPDQAVENPPIIVVPHPCGGSAQDSYSRVAAGLPAQADDHGFILIFPQTPNNCWDCSSTKSLIHDGGGDTQGIVSMVNYTLETYNGDPTQVFVTGSSSGGMVTNALVATYPDVFAAGSSFSGAPAFGCWAGFPTQGEDDPRCQNEKTPSPSEWLDIIVSAYPEYEGQRPRMQIWHGTMDTVVTYAYLGDQLNQWSAVHGVEFAGNMTNDPESGYTKMVYGDGDSVIGYSAQGVGHIVPFHEKEVLEFFGLL